MRTFHCLLISLFIVATATKLFSTEKSSAIICSQHLGCDLDAPSNFEALDIGPTSAIFHWTTVPGAAKYKIKVFKLYTGQLVRDTTVNGNVSFLKLTDLNTNTNYRVRISSICMDGLESPNTNDIGFQTFILDLVVSGFTSNNNIPNCTIGASGNNSCTFPANGTSTQFLLTNGIISKLFVLQIVNGHFNFVLQNTGGDFQFWGITTNGNSPAPPPAYNIEYVRITASGGEDFIANLIIEKNSFGEGQIRLGVGGIASGFLIHRIKGWGPSIPIQESLQAPPASSAQPIVVTEDRNNTNASSPLKVIAVENPFSDHITLKLQSSVEDLVSLQLFDLQGRRLLTQECAGGEEQYTILTNNVAPGLYLLRVEIGAFAVMLKIIKSE